MLAAIPRKLQRAYADRVARHAALAVTPQERIDAITLLLFAAVLLGPALTLAGCMPGVVTVDTGR